jgi:hypothetical protein
MVTLNEKQLTAIARFNREFSIKSIEISNEDDKVKVRAVLNTRSEKVKAFFLNSDGGLAGIVKDETS